MKNLKEDFAKIKLPLSENDYEKLKEISYRNDFDPKDVPMEYLTALAEKYDEEYSGEYGMYD